MRVRGSGLIGELWHLDDTPASVPKQLISLAVGNEK